MSIEEKAPPILAALAMLEERVRQLAEMNREHGRRLDAVEKELVRRINYVYGVVAAVSVIGFIAVYALDRFA